MARSPWPDGHDRVERMLKRSWAPAPLLRSTPATLYIYITPSVTSGVAPGRDRRHDRTAARWWQSGRMGPSSGGPVDRRCDRSSGETCASRRSPGAEREGHEGHEGPPSGRAPDLGERERSSGACRGEMPPIELGSTVRWLQPTIVPPLLETPVTSSMLDDQGCDACDCQDRPGRLVGASDASPGEARPDHGGRPPQVTWPYVFTGARALRRCWRLPLSAAFADTRLGYAGDGLRRSRTAVVGAAPCCSGDGVGCRYRNSGRHRC